MMKAVVYTAFSVPEVVKLSEEEKPTPKNNTVV